MGRLFKILVGMIVFVIVFLIGVFAFECLYPSASIDIDPQASKENFAQYFEELEQVLGDHGYSFRPAFGQSDDDPVTDDEMTSEWVSRTKYYKLDENTLVMVDFQNQFGKERYYISIHSPHTDPEVYPYTELLLALCDAVSGHQFSPEDLENVLLGKRGWGMEIKRQAELWEGETVYHAMSIRHDCSWNAIYSVENSLHALEEGYEDLYDNFVINGLTQNGTKPKYRS